jgi:hypothetical protein
MGVADSRRRSFESLSAGMLNPASFAWLARLMADSHESLALLSNDATMAWTQVAAGRLPVNPCTVPGRVCKPAQHPTCLSQPRSRPESGEDRPTFGSRGVS